MADNLTLNAGAGGSVLATDEIGVDHYQRVKLTAGQADNATPINIGNGLAANALSVSIASDSTGQLTANAGTNLNTSALALETGGNLATLAGAVAGTEFQVDVVASLPVGTNSIGQVTANAGTNLNTSALALESGGNLATIAGAVSGTEMQVDVVASLPTGTNSIGQVTANLSAVDNAVLDQIEVNTSYGDNTGGGTESGSLRVTIANDSTGLVSIDDNGGSLTVDNDGTFATQATLSAETTKVIGTINVAAAQTIATTNTGTFAVQSTLQANSGVDIGDVDVTSISAGANLIGDVGLSGARTSGGTTFHRNIDVDETEDAVKASAGQIYWIQCSNIDATPIYLHFYNAGTGSVTVGTTTPDLTFLVPSQGDANGAGFVLSIPNGIAFSTAITVAATTTVGGSAGPGTNEVILNLGFA